MKIYKLNEFAFKKKDVLDKLSNWRKPIIKNIIKCCVYGNSTNNLSHWINEISAYLSTASEYETKGGKLKYRDYLQCLFLDSGETKQDMKCNLLDFRLENKITNKYPDFEVTEEMYELLYSVFNDISKQCCKLLSEDSHINQDTFSIIIGNIFKEHGIGD